MRRAIRNRIEDAGQAETDVGEEIFERVRLGNQLLVHIERMIFRGAGADRETGQRGNDHLHESQCQVTVDTSLELYFNL